MESNREIESSITLSIMKVNDPVSNMMLLDSFDLQADQNQIDQFYTNSKKEIKSEASALVEHMNLLVESLKDMNEYSLNRHTQYLNQLIPMLNRLIVQTNRLYDLADSDTLNINELGNQFLQIENGFTLFKLSNSELIRLIGDDISLVANIMFILLILIIFAFVAAVRGFVNSQLPYIKSSVLALGNHNYKQDFKVAKPVFVEEKIIHSSIQDLFEENSFIESIRKRLESVFSIEDAIETIFTMLRKRMSVDRIGIAFVDYSKSKFVAEYGVLDKGEILLGPGFEVSFDSTSLTEII